jgi:hypothetical protein
MERKIAIVARSFLLPVASAVVVVVDVVDVVVTTVKVDRVSQKVHLLQSKNNFSWSISNAFTKTS